MIFVFGSNTQGHHGAGAARFARIHHGAVMGRPVGHYGTSYALPTCGRWSSQARRFPPLRMDIIEEYVEQFIVYAKHHPEFQFQVTRVGCGLAGLKDEDIAPMFEEAPSNCQFDSKWERWLPGKKFWGTF